MSNTMERYKAFKKEMSDCDGAYVYWTGGDTVSLDGWFTVDQLRELISIMEASKLEVEDGKDV